MPNVNGTGVLEIFPNKTAIFKGSDGTMLGGPEKHVRAFMIKLGYLTYNVVVKGESVNKE